MREVVAACVAAVIGWAALGAGPASQPAAAPTGPAAAPAALASPEKANARVAAAKAALAAARDAMAKKDAEVTARLQQSPAYRSAKAEADAAAVRWAQAKVDGSPQERIDASSGDAAAREKLVQIRAGAVAGDVEYQRLKDAVAAAEREEKAAEEEARPKPAVTLASALAALPAEARPAPGTAWDDFCLPKAHKVLNQRLVGQRMAFQLPLQSIRIVRIPDPKDPDETVAWHLAVSAEPSEIATFHTPTFVTCAAAAPAPAAVGKGANNGKSGKAVWEPGRLEFEVPESLAREARAWRPGDALSIEGTVSEVSADQQRQTDEGESRGLFTAVLKDVTVTGHSAPPAPRPATPRRIPAPPRPPAGSP